MVCKTLTMTTMTFSLLISVVRTSVFRERFPLIFALSFEKYECIFHQFTLKINRSIFWRVGSSEGHVQGAVVLEAYISPVKFQHFRIPDRELFVGIFLK